MTGNILAVYFRWANSHHRCSSSIYPLSVMHVCGYTINHIKIKIMTWPCAIIKPQKSLYAYCSFSSCIFSIFLKKLTAVFLILSFSTVVLAVTAEYPWNTAAGIGAFKLTGQTHVDICKTHTHTHRVITLIWLLAYWSQLRYGHRFSLKLWKVNTILIYAISLNWQCVTVTLPHIIGCFLAKS